MLSCTPSHGCLDHEARALPVQVWTLSLNFTPGPAVHISKMCMGCVHTSMWVCAPVHIHGCQRRTWGVSPIMFCLSLLRQDLPVNWKLVIFRKAEWQELVRSAASIFLPCHHAWPASVSDPWRLLPRPNMYLIFSCLWLPVMCWLTREIRIGMCSLWKLPF